MSKTLTLSLNKKLIIEAVKADTYITGAIDKSADGVKNAALAYNEQAGDDLYHERKLTRTLAGAVGSLEANLAEFVDSSVDGAISDTLANVQESGDFTITVKVSDRYNSGLAYPIAQLSQEYIVNKMLYYWWQSIRPALAKDYLSFSAESLTNIRLCLAKKAPATANAYYEDVTGSISGSTSGDTIAVDASLTQSSGKYTATKTNLVSYYNAKSNLIIDCTTQSAGFNVLDGDAVLFSFSGTPYSLSAANFAKISGATSANIDFVPVNELGDTNVVILKHIVPAS